MRIVGGFYKGRNLVEFKGEEVRPTSDMVRESLFNILRDRIEGCTFLDLFSGTGAMGIEALSRGAKKVTFNDIKRDSIKIINENLAKLKITDNVKVTNFDAISFIEKTNEKYDVIFLDPPYKTNLGVLTLSKISKILAEDGVVIYENEKEYTEDTFDLEIVDKRKYGRAYLTFFKELK